MTAALRAAPAGLLAIALGSAACGHSRAATVPISVPLGAPPSVQVPVESAPIGSPVASERSAAVDPQTRRFDIVDVDDTTITILLGSSRWVRRGSTGIAVDPTRRDALVARFRVVSRANGRAVALVTGQTTRVLSSHVALLREPVRGPLRQGVFWTGLLVGVATGVGTVLVVRR